MRRLVTALSLIMGIGSAIAESDPYRVLALPPGQASPFQSIRIYRVDRHATPHWLFVTSGLRTGRELSLRVPLADKEPPEWAPSLLLYLGGYALSSTAPLESPTFIDLAGPTEMAADWGFVGAVLVADPVLRGKPRVDQVVGLTADELALVRGWSPKAWAELVRARNPLFLSPRERPSLLADAAFGAGARRRAAREGSALAELAVGHSVCSRSGGDVVVEIGANAVRTLPQLLRGRLGLGRPLRLSSPDGIVDLEPGRALSARLEKGCSISLPAATARELADALRPVKGDYAVGPGVVVRVVPSVVRDESGATQIVR